MDDAPSVEVPVTYPVEPGVAPILPALGIFLNSSGGMDASAQARQSWDDRSTSPGPAEGSNTTLWIVASAFRQYSHFMTTYSFPKIIFAN